MDGITGMSGMMSPYSRINQMTHNMIKGKDKNGDHALTFEEFGGTQDVFNSIDKNGDGKLGTVELNAAGMSRSLDRQTNDLIRRLDKNGDGALSADEMGLSANVFSTIDTNGDGLASLSELNTAYIAKQAMKQYQQTMNSASPTTSSTASTGSSSSIIA
jgi:Ca2+-binding EF-hand superfamily protein